MISPSEQINAVMAHLQQGGTPRAALSSSPFGGHDDGMLARLGIATSASSPGTYDPAFATTLRNAVERLGMHDRDVTRLSQMTGVNVATINSLTNLFSAQMGGMFSTGTDFVGGTLSMARAINPLIGTFGDVGGARFSNFEQFNRTLLERVQDRLDPTVSDAPAFSGIFSTRDASDILTFATRRGLVDTRPQVPDGSGGLREVSAEEMAERGEEVLDRFDALLEAGRRVFGANTKAADVLQRMQSFGGDMMSRQSMEGAAGRALEIRNMAFLTGGSAEAMFQSQARLSQSLVAQGMSQNMAGLISSQATLEAGFMGGDFGFDNSIRALMGYNGPRVSFETYQNVAAQNRAIFMSREENQVEMLRQDYARRGIEVSDDVLRGEARALRGRGGAQGVVAQDIVESVLGGADVDIVNETSIRRMRAFVSAGASAGMTDGVLANYRAARFGDDANKSATVAALMARLQDPDADTVDADMASLASTLGVDSLTQRDLMGLRRFETISMAGLQIDPAARAFQARARAMMLGEGALEGQNPLINTFIRETFFPRQVQLDEARINSLRENDSISGLVPIERAQAMDGDELRDNVVSQLVQDEETNAFSTRFFRVEGDANAVETAISGSTAAAEDRISSTQQIMRVAEEIIGMLINALRDAFVES